MSAQSEDFFEGFKAGVRAKHEKERERHRESVHESESVLIKGWLLYSGWNVSECKGTSLVDFFTVQ